MTLKSYAQGQWFEGKDENSAPLHNAITGDNIGSVSSAGLNFKEMTDYARDVGGKNLLAMSMHERAMMLKNLAKFLDECKQEFYDLSYATGATKGDSWVDIDGGIATFFVYSSKGRRELADENIVLDGNLEQISREGTFLGQHVMVPMKGVAVHINAFNFPVWGMMEKLAPTLLAGLPAIVKPATSTSYLTKAVFEKMIESGLLPEGAIQLICGSVGDLLSHLTCQDVVSFTGSAWTASKLTSHPTIMSENVRFVAECDSLNCSILGEDAAPDTEEFKLYVKEVVREMTVKAGQKCTAIRRAIVPEKYSASVVTALQEILGKTTMGDPTIEGVRMGALASISQRDEVRERVEELSAENEIVHGDMDNFAVKGGNRDKGAFFPPILMLCNEPFKKLKVHNTEAFGPVATVIPYKNNAEAITLANMGEGSLVASVFSKDKAVVKELVMGIGPYHGRIAVINEDCAKESTGHGSPLPHLKHGGPGRAGGGEELGGILAVKHYMQRVALQGSPDILTGTTNKFIKGAEVRELNEHPFRKNFHAINVGDSLFTKSREVTLEDVEHFAHFTGDEFYAHMLEEAAAANPFFEGRVAHGYLILSFAAGLFVDPEPGPVLANYGLNDLQFQQPLYPGDSMSVRLTCKQKIPRAEQIYGEVRWDVEATNQDGETVATYELLTLNAYEG